MADGVGLEVAHLTVRFGGTLALDDVTVNAPLGTVTGLIGPNGAGKTTLFNACFGRVRLGGGSIRLFETEITRFTTTQRAQLGLGRTFQRMQLFESLTVEENVVMGCQAAQAGSNVLLQLHTGRARHRKAVQACHDALGLCGLLALRHRSVFSLSTGQRRLVEFARVLASPARLLLLDEPSSGLDRAESDHFGEILRQSMAASEIGILLVEHDMTLVSQVCEYLHVLDFGHHLLQGATAEVLGSDVLQAAYLGSSATPLVDQSEGAQP